MILLLHTLIEGSVALLFLFYPGVENLLPGFADGRGGSFTLLLKMYGLAAGFLAALSLTAWLRREDKILFLTTTGSLTVFHLGMATIQGLYNPDGRVLLLHFLLAIFLGGRYVRARKADWAARANNV